MPVLAALPLLAALAAASPPNPLTGSLSAGAFLTGQTNPLTGGTEVLGRLGLYVSPTLELEVAMGGVESRTRGQGLPYRMYTPRLGGSAHFRLGAGAELALGAGVGLRAMTVEGGDESDLGVVSAQAPDFLVSAGPALLIRVGGPVHLRADARWLATLGPPLAPGIRDAFSDGELLLGIDLRSPARADQDGDGVRDYADECPTTPGPDDPHGCPARDADHDGVNDSIDRCPDASEDPDGVEDADGCPDVDDDHDGVPDMADRCPQSAEDLDDFSDDDGCPEPDNDQDGIPDVLDGCPIDPESVNGVDDGDGCPDVATLPVR